MPLRFPVLDHITHITNHHQLPNGVEYLAEVTIDSHIYVRPRTFVFVKNGHHLSILSVFEPANGRDYRCDQYDFPLGFLSWFPQTLHDYRLPPAQSPYSGMETPPMDIDGEMLTLGRMLNNPGYCATNWSRCDHDDDPKEAKHRKFFSPNQLSWSEQELYVDGVLALIVGLGEKLDKGQL